MNIAEKQSESVHEEKKQENDQHQLPIVRKQIVIGNPQIKPVHEERKAVSENSKGDTENQTDFNQTKCPKCNISFKPEGAHNILTHKCKDFQCLKCQEKFYFKFQLSQHYVKVHEEKNTVFVAIEAHEGKNDNIEPQKSEPQKIIPQVKDTNTTLELRVHFPHGNLKCKTCGKLFLNKAFLSLHIKSDHVNETEEVRESSSDLTNVTLEEVLPTLPENEENPWRKNQYLQRLNSELSSEPDHENISKNFKCNLCGFNFSKKVFLQHHIVKAHNRKKTIDTKDSDQSGNPIEIYQKQTENPWVVENKVFQQIETFKCIDCSLEFSSKQSLEDHYTSVHEESVLKCSICSIELSSIENMKHHVESIHGLKLKPNSNIDSNKTDALDLIKVVNIYFLRKKLYGS